MNRIGTWLLGRPKPTRPPRRITTITSLVAAIAAMFVLPPVPDDALHNLRAVLGITIVCAAVALAGIIGAGYARGHRRRNRP